MKKLTLLMAALLVAGTVVAQENAEPNSTSKYRRSSLFTVLIEHPSEEFGTEITEAFMTMPHPDKFDDHDLPEFKKIRSSVESGKTKKKKTDLSDQNYTDIERYLDHNKIARQMVAKWFSRCPETGAFNMDLIGERGHYDATLSDVAEAKMSARGQAMLADAGEELIGNTFVVISDITYIKKEEKTKKAGGILRVAGAVAGSFVDGADQIGNMAADMTEKFGGFGVKIKSYLYRLDWNEEVAATFYQDYWVDESNPDEARKTAFDNEDMFKLAYIGSTESTAGNLSVKGFTSKDEKGQIRKVCTRALDRSIVELQREYDEFKVKVPIHDIQGNDIFVQIGLKEGINDKSQFEVLEMVETEDGRTEYKKVGVIAPVKGEIWDNRFMAAEEAAELKAAGVKNTDEEASMGNVNLTATKFRKVSGRDIYPGMLVRESTIKVAKK